MKWNWEEHDLRYLDTFHWRLPFPVLGHIELASECLDIAKSNDIGLYTLYIYKLKLRMQIKNITLKFWKATVDFIWSIKLI